MPELPQVKGFVTYFKSTCLHKKIDTTYCEDEDFIENTSCSYLQHVLNGRQFIDVYRRGKYLIAELDDNHVFVLHFGMTGNLSYGLKKNVSDDDKQYAKVILEFEKDYQLLLINVRKLGKLYLTTSLENIKPLKNMGPEPLKLEETNFITLLENHPNKNIKSFLMDQSLIAGIGNELSNELLFQAEIDPHLKIKNINDKKRKKLYAAMQDILKKAVNIFTKNKDSSQYPKSWLLAHQEDLVCPKNKKHDLKKETIAGRSAIYCPLHQSN
ncbi:DNA-formamidopyrimidine glycosylase family protein [Legionella impletisoli]|uniref:Formamidopyrimidine-DNA glycosylase n=1 Tax=Legionella impletisoli TaxID=343510 RepID=A0A917NBS9_9GAMM|nr:DNA-formamidopyrimidine glycosylase family protein [Legionella impletisoli]GGI81674.1 formamidopyrimidine-DNA glycosylase [Legionella impletisoli]